jgi:deoxyribonuclease V
VVRVTHDWQVSRDEAAAIQQQLADEVTMQPVPAEGPGSPRYVAGVDVSYSRDGSRAWAAALVMDRRFRVLASTTTQGTPDSPFEHGYLAFREGRLTLEVLSYLEVEPDLVFLDAHGVVHERGLGMASHIGVVLGVPTIGVPKTPYHPVIQAPGPARGDYYVMRTERGAEGAAIRLKARVKPVYVSPGHLVDLPSAIALSLVWSTGRRRLPEPLAAAHTLSLKVRDGAL